MTGATIFNLIALLLLVAGTLFLLRVNPKKHSTAVPSSVAQRGFGRFVPILAVLGIVIIVGGGGAVGLRASLKVIDREAKIEREALSEKEAIANARLAEEKWLADARRKQEEDTLRARRLQKERELANLDAEVRNKVALLRSLDARTGANPTPSSSGSLVSLTLPGSTKGSKLEYGARQTCLLIMKRAADRLSAQKTTYLDDTESASLEYCLSRLKRPAPPTLGPPSKTMQEAGVDVFAPDSAAGVK